MAITFDKARTSITFKSLFIGLLVLILLVPMGMVESVISERNVIYRQVNEEITNSWGKDLVLGVPVLTYTDYKNMGYSNGTYIYGYKHIRPEELSIKANLDTRIRQRGIYKVPVYTANVVMKGNFNLPVMNEESIGYDNEILIQLPATARSIRKPPRLILSGEPVNLTAHKDSASGESVIFKASLPGIITNPDNNYSFEIHLELTGSNEFSFISWAKQTNIDVTSNWDSPGFSGSSLPASHKIGKTGFTARWMVNNLFEDTGHENDEIMSRVWFANEPKFGVKLVQPVDTYQRVTRATKYAVLFITLVFTVYFLIEILGDVILHPVQYLFIGFAKAIFYLLLLSLAEHINFDIAYLISAAASVLLISLYSISILKSRQRAALIFATLTGLYSFLYTTLESEDLALLIGSLGLFTVLSYIMYITRHFNWYKMAESQK